jgi:SAM-dependent methyltransferase
MEERFQNETEWLVRSWSKHNSLVLRDYLVKDVEDPRINVQSILTRHWLINQLLGDKYDELMEHEIRFALVMNWLLKLLKKNVRTSQLQAILYCLIEKQNNAEGIEIPLYISETFSKLSMPNYICDALNLPVSDDAGGILPDYIISTFGKIWKEILANEEHEKISVLEPACGSANDYRFIDAFGIAGFLNYHGFDLCQKNVFNAKQMFPDVNFSVGNAIEIQAEDNVYDYCFVHDLFEHLSVEAMECAISEIRRVTKYGVCVGFFNMHDGNEHIVHAVDEYHWNKLSINKMRELLTNKGSEVEVIHIDSFLFRKYGFSDTHNKNACTFIVKI